MDFFSEKKYPIEKQTRKEKKKEKKKFKKIQNQ